MSSSRGIRTATRTRLAGVTIVEFLIVLAVVAILVGLVAMNGRRVLLAQEQNAAITSLQQTVWQGATAAAARGVVTRLTRVGDSFRLVDTDSGRVLRSFELPNGVATNWPNGEGLEFTPPGKVDPATLQGLPSPLTMTARDRTTVLTISLIGEVKAEAQ